MNRIISVLLIFVGIMNLYPAIGVLSADTLAGLYSVTILDTDLQILMRHRAILLGILGSFIIASVFRPHLQESAIIVGLISMVTFIGLVLGTGNYGESIMKVMLADVIGSLALIVVLFLKWKITHANNN